ncbi:MAG: amidase family protein [Acidimicrobiales bacterium]
MAEHSFYEGLEIESEIHQAIATAMQGVDALVMPTVGSSGWLADDDYVDNKLTVGGVVLDDYFESMFTPLFNIASRHPVLNVPSGIADNGVPTGMQIIGHTYDDATTFEIGGAVEREMGGWWADPTWWSGMSDGRTRPALSKELIADTAMRMTLDEPEAPSRWLGLAPCSMPTQRPSTGIIGVADELMLDLGDRLYVEALESFEIGDDWCVALSDVAHKTRDAPSATRFGVGGWHPIYRRRRRASRSRIHQRDL